MYRLRELERKDLQQINRWRNDAELISQLGAPFRYINLDVDAEWFESYMKNRSNAVRCAVVAEADDAIIGLISLTSVDWLNRSAELQIMIGDKANRGKGIGTFAVRHMLSHAFSNMNLHRVELSVLESNLAARHLYEKCGFAKEGVRRCCRFKNGKYETMLLYGLLKEEYRCSE